MKRKLIQFAALIFFSISVNFVFAQIGQNKKILYIDSQSCNSFASKKMIEGFESVLSKDYSINFQFMELNMIPDDEKYSSFYNRVNQYIKENDFDAFFLADNDALNFALMYREELFKDKPMVFAGVEDFELIRRGVMDEKITGVRDVLYFDENVLLARRIFPELRKIVLIRDNSFLGKTGSEVFSELKNRFHGTEFTEINTADYTITEIHEMVDNLADNSVVFYLSSGQTKNGFIKKINKMIINFCSEKNIPIMASNYSACSNGVIGGYYISNVDAGVAAANLVKKVFEGVDIRYLDINSECKARYCFDKKMITQYGIRKALLPSDTIYINENEAGKSVQIAWIIIMIILILMIVFCLVLYLLELSRKKNLNAIIQESREMLHAVMDQSETIYWECDFSESMMTNTESSLDDEYLEELEVVEDADELEQLEKQDEEDDEVELIPHKEQSFFEKNALNVKTSDVMQGWIYSGVIQREYREQFFQMLNDFREGKTNSSIEIDIPIGLQDIRNKVQTERWKHIVYRAIKTENGKVMRAICSATDVTSQKRAEREYEGIMKYQSFVQQSYPAYSRFNLTKNTVLERLINIPDISRSIKGNSAVSELEFFRELITMRGENEGFAASLVREELIIAFKNGARQKKCDFCYKFTSGALHWYTLHMELAFNPTSGDIEVYSYLKDITNETISDVTKDSVLNEDVEYIFWLNKNTGVCHFINKAQYINWLPEKDTIDYENFISTLVKKRVADNDKNEVTQAFELSKIEEQLSDKKEIQFTFHSRKDDGSIEIKQEKVYYLEPNSNILIYVCTDITAITLMENQQNEKLAQAIKAAEKANYAKSDFLSRMSHDLRTPMNGIMGITELASKELDNPEALERDINKIRSSSSYMLGLLNDILDMSKIESGKMELRKSASSFGDILENIITLAHSMCDNKGITFYCNKDPVKYKNYIVNVDRLHIQQVAMNLLSNASKYTPGGGRIEFLLDSEGQEGSIVHLRIIVRDTGAGMTKEFQKIMYDAFTQDINSVNKVGTGLGLAIVRNLVRLMNGTIECISAPGEGTEFTIKIDIEVLDDGSSENSEKKPEAETKKEVSLKGKRALLVEDNELNQEIASRLLQNEGMEVEIAGNGLEALNKYSEKGLHHFDVVLMDVMMPVMDGLQATHLLRTLEREDAKTVPIIAMTANAFTEDIEKCLAAGMNTHIAKPIETEKMINTIKEYIAKSMS